MHTAEAWISSRSASYYRRAPPSGYIFLVVSAFRGTRGVIHHASFPAHKNYLERGTSLYGGIYASSISYVSFETSVTQVIQDSE